MQTRPGEARRARRGLLALAAVGMGALGLVAAGCGSSPSSQVAQLGTTSTPTTTDSAPSGGGGGPSAGVAPGRKSGSGSGSGFSIGIDAGANGARFSACMRSHGVSNFPDPNGKGEIHLDSSTGVNPQSAQFQAAQKACRKLLPNGGAPTPQQQAQAQQRALKFSQCMRSHGVPKFPDPQIGNGRIGIRIGPGSGIDPNSAQFKSAQQACQKLLGGPFGPKGGPG
jgi:hypothetical protein